MNSCQEIMAALFKTIIVMCNDSKFRYMCTAINMSMMCLGYKVTMFVMYLVWMTYYMICNV